MNFSKWIIQRTCVEMAKVLWYVNLAFPFKLQLIDSHCTQSYISCLRLEWPSPHDCTSSVWDELVFIPVIEHPAVRKVEWKKFFAHPSTVNLFFTLYRPYSPNYPIYPPTLLILQWQNLYLFLTKFIILGKIYISS
jgi:hypothetical protein